MPDMDQGIKRLIQTHAADLLALALPGAEYIGTFPVDLATEPQLTLDTLLHVRYHGIECAVNLEAEARPKPDIGRRLFEYGARASIVTGLPILSVVLWLERDGAPAASPYVLRADDRLICEWHFIGVQLFQLPAEELIQTGLVGLLPLVPFASGVDAQVIERTAELVKAEASPAELGELEALLFVFAGRNFEAEFLLNIARRLEMSTEIIEQSSLYQLWIQQSREKALAEGREQGLEEGRERGLREAALLTLHARFGELPPELTAAIAQAHAGTLEALLAHVPTDTLDQIRSLLAV